MSETGLQFSAQGASSYEKILRTVQRAVSRLDSALKKVAKTSESYDAVVDDLNESFSSGTRRMGNFIKRLDAVRSAIADLAKDFPKLSKDIEKGFLSSSMVKAFEDQGRTIAKAFREAIEKELGIRSPSRVMRNIASMVNKGFEDEIAKGNYKKIGADSSDNFLSGLRKNLIPGVQRLMRDAVTAVQSGVRQIRSELESAGNNLKNYGSNLINGGLRGIAAGGIIAGATLGIGGGAVNSAMQFQQIMVNSQSILGATNEEMATLNNQILQMGGDSVAGVTATAESYYAIVSGVQDASSHMDILTAAIETSEAGQANLSATTSGLISVMNSYGTSNITAARTSDVFSRTVQMGVGSMDQFVAAMSPIAGLSASVGVSFDELGTGMAFLTAQGATTGAAATRLQNAMVALLRPNADMARVLQELGYESGQAAIEQLGLVGALDAVYGALDEDSAGFARALGSVEALQGAIGLLNDDYAEFANHYEAGLNDATATARQTQLDALYAVVGQLRSGFHALTIEVGNALMPVVRQLGQQVLNVVSAARDWIDNNRELFQVITRVVFGGTLLLGALVAMASAGAVLAGVMSFGLGSSLLGVTGLLFNPLGLIAGFATFAATLASVVPIIGLVIAAVATISQIIDDVRNNVGGAGDAFADMSESFGDFASVIGQILSAMGTLVGQFLGAGSAAERSFSPVTRIFRGIESTLDRITSGLVFVANGLNALTGTTTTSPMTSQMQRENELLQERERILQDINDAQADVTEQQTIQVEAGDTLYDLARQYNTTVDAIREANDIQGSMIYAGQDLVIPVSVDGGAASDELYMLQGQLEQVDEQLGMIGSDGQMNVPTEITEINDDLLAMRSAVDLVVSGFALMFTGDIVGGFDVVRNGIAQIRNAIGGLFDSFLGGTQQTVQPIDAGLGIAIDPGVVTETQNPFLDRIRGYINAVRDFDFGQAVDVVKNKISGIWSDGIASLSDIVGENNPFVDGMGALADEVKGHDFSAIEQAIADNMGSIINAGVALFQLFLGFPVGTALGVGRLVATAIENDFLGIGTFLETSGIRATFETTIADLWAGLQSALSGIMGGGQQTAVVDAGLGIAIDPGAVTQQGNLLTGLIAMFADLGNTVTTLVDIFGAPVQQLISGIQGFFVNLFSALNAEHAQGAVQNVMGILGVLGNVFGFLLQIAGGIAAVGSAGLIEGVGNALDEVGTMIGSFIDVILALLAGDIGGAIDSLGNFLQALVAIPSQVTEGFFNGVINAVNELFGLELGEFSWAQAFADGWLTLQTIVDNIERGLESFATNVQTQIINFVRGIDQATQAVGIDLVGDEYGANVTGRASGMATQDAIGQTLSQQIAAGGGLNLDVPINVNGTEMTLQDAINVVPGADFGVANTEAVRRAVAAAIEADDTEALQVLLPLAASLDIEIDNSVFENNPDLIQQQLYDAALAGDTETLTELIPVAASVGINIDDVFWSASDAGGSVVAMQDAILASMGNAFEGGDSTTVAALTPMTATWGVDIEYFTTTYQGTEGYEAVRQGILESMAQYAGEGDEAGLQMLVPMAVSLGIESDEVLESADAAGYTVGDSIKSGLESSLEIASPSQYAINVGMNLMNALASGFNMMFPVWQAAIFRFQLGMMLLIPTTNIMVNSMIGALSKLSTQLLKLADEAWSLQNYLLSITIQMAEIGLASAAAAGTAGTPVVFGGGRAFGGHVSAKEFYELNEGGITEYGEIGGKRYLFPGDDGVIEPLTAADVVGGSSAASAASGAAQITNMYNGDINITLPPGVENYDEIYPIVYDAIEAYHETTTISEDLRNKL